RTAPIVLLPPSRQGDNHHAPAPGLASNAPADLDSADLWQAELEKSHVGPQLFGGLDGGEAVVHDERAMSTQLQKRGNRVRTVSIVIDDQNAARGHLVRAQLERPFER